MVENFSYYYTTLKKYNAIKDLQREGFDTKEIYPTDELDPHHEDKLKKFDAMTVQMIFDTVRNKLAKIEGDYGAGTNTKTCFANEGLEALLDGLSAAPEIGVNLPGDTYNTIVRGARKGKFYLQSSGTGVGKTRRIAKDSDCQKDMDKEGLDLETDGEWIWAKGTSLGADNAVAVAAVLAILDDDTLSHPPIEAVLGKTT